MTIEQSHGIARPTLPRVKDLPPAVPEGAEPVEKPTAERAAHGHFADGNDTGKLARFVHTIRKALGDRKASSALTKTLARDARRIWRHTLDSMPSDAAPVQILCSVLARETVLFSHYSTLASKAGLHTKKGAEWDAKASHKGQRIERLLVSLEDVSGRHAIREALVSETDTTTDMDRKVAERAKKLAEKNGGTVGVY